MLLNRAEKEKRVIELYKLGKTIREIAKEVHMSFKDISSVIKKYMDEDEEGENKITLSKDIQAIKLFSQNKSTLDVVIELGLNADKVERIFKKFWKLKGLDVLYNAYEKI
jgi:transcriptional regulator